MNKISFNQNYFIKLTSYHFVLNDNNKTIILDTDNTDANKRVIFW